MKKILTLAFILIGSFSGSKNLLASYFTDTDLMTDEIKIKIFLESETTTPNSIGSPEPAQLWIRCNLKNQLTNKIEAFVITPTFNTDNNIAGLRWDSGTPLSESWNSSTDQTALFSRNPKEFIRNLYESNTLVFQWQPYSSIKRAVRFNLEELKENISKARLEGCDF